MGSSNQGSVSLGREGLLGNRYIRISSISVSSGIFRLGILQAVVNLTVMWLDDQERKETELAGNKFPEVYRWGKHEFEFS